MSGIFVSYRRSDSAYIAGRLRDDLAEQFGDGLLIFRDIETMPLGSFPDEIAEAIRSCDAMLVIIGQGWLSATGAGGTRRLDDPGDWVRREIAAGLAQHKIVVPVLVEGARLPAAPDLPGDLHGLVLQQAVELPDARWDYELGRLADQMRAALGIPVGVRLLTGPWTSPDAPVRLTVEKVEVQAASLRLHLVVENRTSDGLFLPSDSFDLTDDTGHQYPPNPASPDWANDFGPGTSRGVVDVDEGLWPAAKTLQAGWVRALGTFEVGSIYATVPIGGNRQGQAYPPFRS
ncbi:MAG: toll/interleukin-1 receptor domain-containing protein [Acidimicrobiales bacterium]